MWVMDNGYAIAKSELSPNFSSYISDDQMVFRDISVSSGTISMQYKAYEKKTTSFGMEPALGLGFYLPFKYIRPNFLITGFYGPSLTGYSDYYGYRLSGRLDFGKRITLGVNYATIIHDKDAFLPSYFSPGRGNYTLTDMNDLTENNTRKHNRIELTLGIKLATWGN